ncbi:hypothetical protein [Scytonema sp. PRP1]
MRLEPQINTDDLSVFICVAYGTAYAYICGFIYQISTAKALLS